MTGLWLGATKVDITPRTPVPLAGFAHRTGVSEGVAHPLYLRAFVLAQGGVRVVWITADLIWWGPELAGRLRRRISDGWSIPQAHVLLHATHNHSGPQTTARFTAPLGRPDEEYIRQLEAAAAEAVAAASGHLEPVSLAVGTGVWGAGVNRRRVIDGVSRMAPNPEGPNDPRVTVLSFVRPNGRPKALWVHATCHPTTTDDNRVSPDFPGVAMDALEALLGGGTVAGFLQGFCGDVRPNLTRNGEFIRGTQADVEHVAGQLVDAVGEVLHTPLRDAGAPLLKVTEWDVPLRYARVPGEDELGQAASCPGIRGEWAKRLMAERERRCTSVPLHLTTVRLTGGIGFVAADAEMVCDYGLNLRRISQGRLLPVGYTNGMIGYVPTAGQIREGGYEPYESCFYFALPSPFDERIEAAILDAFHHIEKGCWS
ncbi:neutral/alkaline non-lysosomal ceramidase N-terminal domain-containing protein [Alicyclobacillus sp.]|uniref:neutral/alkaline non-lysosomal ceramidase N-terminal domain-containing protein n=1 Tax=Alicyclobacillus sp. TaxID=61169 RepID=UPI0025BA6D1C|nr:neutral/alkaline non-lysosomal ceramidase N-terminal domain-containing protein [Alicyclobacillus sp.]MCL6516653.1 neutral/alkaline non-lysosomal ceramidase N-terminal domain-containing protein [Alicyclobacillus sp.]